MKFYGDSHIVKMVFTCVILPVIMSLSSAAEAQVVTGKWRLSKIHFLPAEPNDTLFILDLSKPDKVKADLYKSYDFEEGEDAEDSVTVKKDIEKTVKQFQKARLHLSNNNRFNMISNDIIISEAYPGRHIGNTINGKWKKEDDQLILTAGSANKELKYNFTIVKLTARQLVMKQVVEGLVGREHELWFEKE